MKPSLARSQDLRAVALFSLIWGVSIRIIGVALGVYAIYRVKYVLVTVLMSALLALVMNPMVDALCGIRLPLLSLRARRFMITLLAFIALFVVIGYANYFLLGPVRHEIKRLMDTVDDRQGAIHSYVQVVNQWYGTLPPDLRSFLTDQISANGPRLAEGLRSLLGTTLQWVGHIVEWITIPVLAFYFVLDSKPLKREFLYLMPRRRVREAIVLLHQTGVILQAYALAQIILCLLAAVVVGVGLWGLGVKYALTLGILAGVTRAIPIIGPIIGGIPIVLIASLQSPQVGVGVLIFFSLLHLIESKVVMPHLLGDRMHLHPAIILIVLLIGAEFFGILGMFLSAPVAALLKVVYDFYVLGRRPWQRRPLPPLRIPNDPSMI